MVEAKETVEELQNELMHSLRDEELQKKETNAVVNYGMLLVAEEEFYREKSRVKWLKERDRNTTFLSRKIRPTKVTTYYIYKQRMVAG